MTPRATAPSSSGWSWSPSSTTPLPPAATRAPHRYPSASTLHAANPSVHRLLREVPTAPRKINLFRLSNTRTVTVAHAHTTFCPCAAAGCPGPLAHAVQAFNTEKRGHLVFGTRLPSSSISLPRRTLHLSLRATQCCCPLMWWPTVLSESER